MARKKGSKKAKKKKVDPVVKAFKNQEEIKDFYRFVNDNNLRHESKVIMETILSHIDLPKKRKTRKSKAKTK